MTPKIHHNHPKKPSTSSNLSNAIVRPQRKMLSRYKFKKQLSMAEKILEDQQIINT